MLAVGEERFAEIKERVLDVGFYEVELFDVVDGVVVRNHSVPVSVVKMDYVTFIMDAAE